MLISRQANTAVHNANLEKIDRCKVTLRKDCIYSFLDKLTLVILPRLWSYV